MVETYSNWILLGILGILPFISVILMFRAARNQAKSRKIDHIIDRYDSVHQAVDDFMELVVSYLPIMNETILSSLERVKALNLTNPEYIGRLIVEAKGVQSLVNQITTDNPNSEARSAAKTEILFGVPPNPIKSIFLWVILVIAGGSLAAVNYYSNPTMLIYFQIGVAVTGYIILVLAYRRYGQSLSLRSRAENYASLKVSLYNSRREYVNDIAESLLNQHVEFMGSSQQLSSIPQSRGFFNGLVIMSKLGNSASAVFKASNMDLPAPLFAVSVYLEKLVAKKYLAGAKQNHMELTTAIDKGLAFQIDPKDFERLMNALVANAITFSKPGAKILIRGKRRGDKIILSVTDTGIGIAKQDLPYIFDPLHRPNSQTEQSFVPSLGLQVSRVIINRIGGELKIASKEGKGTVATVIASRKKTDLKLDIPRHVSRSSGALS